MFRWLRRTIWMGEGRTFAVIVLWFGRIFPFKFPRGQHVFTLGELRTFGFKMFARDISFCCILLFFIWFHPPADGEK